MGGPGGKDVWKCCEWIIGRNKSMVEILSSFLGLLGVPKVP